MELEVKEFRTKEYYVGKYPTAFLDTIAEDRFMDYSTDQIAEKYKKWYSEWFKKFKQLQAKATPNKEAVAPQIQSTESNADAVTAKEKGRNRVNHPAYYTATGPIKKLSNGEIIHIECIDVIRDMPAWKANVIKYLWRCGFKTEEGLTIHEKELEDMLKAQWYLQNKINTFKALYNL